MVFGIVVAFDSCFPIDATTKKNKFTINGTHCACKYMRAASFMINFQRENYTFSHIHTVFAEYDVAGDKMSIFEMYVVHARTHIIIINSILPFTASNTALECVSCFLNSARLYSGRKNHSAIV